MKAAKKTKSKKSDYKIAIRYGVTIPEKDLMKLIELNCAKAIRDAGKSLFAHMKSMKWDNGKILDFSSPDMRKVCSVAANVLEMIQDSWKEALREYADATKLPKDFIPSGFKPTKYKPAKAKLSNEEIGKIKALRKSGLSIKAIGKEIHRAEKVVRDFVHTLPY